MESKLERAPNHKATCSLQFSLYLLDTALRGFRPHILPNSCFFTYLSQFGCTTLPPTSDISIRRNSQADKEFLDIPDQDQANSRQTPCPLSPSSPASRVSPVH